MQRTFLVCTLSFLILFSFGRVWFYLTDGFSSSGLAAPVEGLSVVELTHEAKDALSMRYKYQGKGCQSYVFASSDGAYVLKFFKRKHLEPPPLANILPASLKNRLYGKREQKRELLYGGYELGFMRAKESSALVYIHLSPSGLDIQTLIEDKLGREERLDLQAYAFVLQKRGVPFNEWVKGQDNLAIRQAKFKIENLLQERVDRGLCDLDPAVEQNIAMIGDTPFFTDLGQFVLGDEDLQNRFSLLRERFEILENH